MRNLSQVIEANYNNILDEMGVLDEEIKKVAEKRMETCLGCVFNSDNGKHEGIYESAIEDVHCSICTCPIKKKVLSMEAECPLHEIYVRDGIAYQYTHNYPNSKTKTMFKVIGQKEGYLEELQKINEKAETVEIDGNKYIKYYIKQKFTKHEI